MLPPDLTTCNEMHLQPNVKRIAMIKYESFIFFEVKRQVSSAAVYSFSLWEGRKKSSDPVEEQAVSEVSDANNPCPHSEILLQYWPLSTWDSILYFSVVLLVSLRVQHVLSCHSICKNDLKVSIKERHPAMLKFSLQIQHLNLGWGSVLQSTLGNS